MWISAKIKVITTLGYFISCIALCLEAISINNLSTVSPPFTDWIKVFGSHRLSLAEMLISFRYIQTIEPCLLCAARMIEEQDVSRD